MAFYLLLVRTSFIRFFFRFLLATSEWQRVPASAKQCQQTFQDDARNDDAAERELRKFAVDRANHRSHRIAFYMLSLDLLNVSEVFKKAFCVRVNTRRANERKGDSIAATALFMRK